MESDRLEGGNGKSIEFAFAWRLRHSAGALIGASLHS